MYLIMSTMERKPSDGGHIDFLIAGCLMSCPGFTVEKSHIWNKFDLAVDFLFILDISFNFRTAYVDEQVCFVVKKPSAVILYYACTCTNTMSIERIMKIA